MVGMDAMATFMTWSCFSTPRSDVLRARDVVAEGVGVVADALHDHDGVDEGPHDALHDGLRRIGLLLLAGWDGCRSS